MVDRRPKLLLDAAQAAELAMMFVGDTTLDAFSADAQRRSATERQLEILGEAFTRLAKEEPALFERLPLARAAITVRNRISHGYDTVDDGIVHATVLSDLPPRARALRAWLSEFEPKR
jgi:uncharacterized protein with HEPN domain